MKWIIGLVVVAMLGGGAYGIYRWTDLPEQGKEWMEEQDLKNFPTQARRELDDMRKELDERKDLQKKLDVDIIKREGRKDWDDANLKTEQKGLATVLWYQKEQEKYGKAITDIVTQIKDQEAGLIDSGVINADGSAIAADHEFSIKRPSGTVVKYTKARAIEETDTIALELKKIEHKLELQQRVITKKKEYSQKLGDLIVKMGEKITEMEVFITEMEVEIELLDLEKDIADINNSISGDGDNNKFGDAIRKFRLKQNEFKAEQELSEKDSPKDDGYFSKEDSTKAAGASASYWN
ncbi:MAG: hypothetical protein V3V10_09040 [Planctomycetota bacterium]